MASSAVTTLLVEDDRVDVEAMRRGFAKAGFEGPLEVVTDGVEALKRLRGEGGVEKLPRPYVVLLDLNMPRLNGIEFLETIRGDEDLRRSIVFVLTTSNDNRDKLAAYDKQVAGYMVKSKAGEEFSKLISMLDHYWRVVEMPPAASLSP